MGPIIDIDEWGIRSAGVVASRIASTLALIEMDE
jgi:hypothetical protein